MYGETTRLGMICHTVLFLIIIVGMGIAWYFQLQDGPVASPLFLFGTVFNIGAYGALWVSEMKKYRRYRRKNTELWFRVTANGLEVNKEFNP